VLVKRHRARPRRLLVSAYDLCGVHGAELAGLFLPGIRYRRPDCSCGFSLATFCPTLYNG
jgi:hypothetical protein